MGTSTSTALPCCADSLSIVVKIKDSPIQTGVPGKYVHTGGTRYESRYSVNMFRALGPMIHRVSPSGLRRKRRAREEIEAARVRTIESIPHKTRAGDTL